MGILLLHIIIILYTVSHKSCNFDFDYNSVVSWAIVTLFVPMETWINALQFTYLDLLTWWRHKCVTTHVTKLWLRQCYLQLETTVANRFLQCVRPNRLFPNFAESGRMFHFPILIEIFLSVFWRREKLLHSHRLLINILCSERSIYYF